jgi:hypothetical protein
MLGPVSLNAPAPANTLHVHVMNLQQLKQHWRQRRLVRQLRGPALQLRQALQALQETKQPFPVLVVAYNNGVHVASMARQLRERGLRPIVIDNASDDRFTVHTLQGLHAQGEAWWVRCAHNHGHQVGFLPPLYAELPTLFAYTDPDLQLNAALPADFLQTLCELTERYRVFKAGFALTLEPPLPAPLVQTRQRLQTRRPVPYEAWLSVREWEAPYWRFKLAGEPWPVYAAHVDTTFAVCSQKAPRPDARRAQTRERTRVAPAATARPSRASAMDPGSGTGWVSAMRSTRRCGLFNSPPLAPGSSLEVLKR